MAIVVEQKASNFTPMSEGLHAAVITSVKDLGVQQTPFGEKHSVAVRFTNAEGEEATRFYTPSLHEKSTLAKDLVVLKGAIPARFDMESLLGEQAQVLVVNKVKDGKVSAKVDRVLKPKAGQKVVAGKATPKSNAITPTNPINDDDLPPF